MDGEVVGLGFRVRFPVLIAVLFAGLQFSFVFAWLLRFSFVFVKPRRAFFTFAALFSGSGRFVAY